MSLCMTSFVHMTGVIGPPGLPSPEVVMDILRFGRVDGALLTPALIDQLCLSPAGVQALRELKYIHYAGAPLSAKSADLLTPMFKWSHASVVPRPAATLRQFMIIKTRGIMSHSKSMRGPKCSTG